MYGYDANRSKIPAITSITPKSPWCYNYALIGIQIFAIAQSPQRFTIIWSHVKGLWDYEVAEVFFLNSSTEEYLELEFGPHRHFLALKFKGPRNGVQTDKKFEFEYQAVIAEKKWIGIAKIPLSLFPENFDRYNCYGWAFFDFQKISSRTSGGLTLTPNMWLSVTPRKWPSIILRKFYSLKNRVIDTHHSKNHEEAYQKRAITTFTRKIVGGYSRRWPPCS